MAVWYSEQMLRLKHILMVQELCEQPKLKHNNLNKPPNKLMDSECLISLLLNLT